MKNIVRIIIQIIMDTIASPGGPPLSNSSSLSSDPFPFIITFMFYLFIDLRVTQFSARVSTAAVVSALTLFWSTLTTLDQNTKPSQDLAAKADQDAAAVEEGGSINSILTGVTMLGKQLKMFSHKSDGKNRT